MTFLWSKDSFVEAWSSIKKLNLDDKKSWWLESKPMTGISYAGIENLGPNGKKPTPR